MEYYDRMFITKAIMEEIDNVLGCWLHSLTLGQQPGRSKNYQSYCDSPEKNIITILKVFERKEHRLL